MNLVIAILLLVYAIAYVAKIVGTIVIYYKLYYTKEIDFEFVKSNQLPSEQRLHLSALENVIMTFVFFYTSFHFFSL